jgi:hypothetical protein
VVLVFGRLIVVLGAVGLGLAIIAGAAYALWANNLLVPLGFILGGGAVIWCLVGAFRYVFSPLPPTPE